MKYLDYNATTPIKPEAKQAVIDALELCGNPSSVHENGRKARGIIEAARSSVATLVGVNCRDFGVIFTGGATESNNLALHQSTQGYSLAVSDIEHPSVRSPFCDFATISVNCDGVIDLDSLSVALDKSVRPMLVSIMTANNETGVIQPIAEAAKLIHAKGGIIHTDAVQAAGRLSLNMAESGVDLLSLSSHKIGGPQGVGALIAAPRLTIKPLLRGGGQERMARAGTENVAGIAGFGVASQLALYDLAHMPRLRSMRDDMERKLRAVAPDLTILGEKAERIVNTSCLAMPPSKDGVVKSETQIMAFDLAGIALSAGSACSSGKVSHSHVLKAMNVDEKIAASAIRFSIGWNTSEDDIKCFIEAWTSLYYKTRN